MLLMLSIWVGGCSSGENDPASAPEKISRTANLVGYVPDYSAGPSSVLIRNNADWKRINDENARFFFVAPGDYTSLGEIVLSASGTAEDPRWVVFYDPETERVYPEHPVKLTKEERATVRQLTVDGNHWRIVGLYGEGYKNQHRTHIIRLNGDYNEVNAVLTEYGSHGGGQIELHGAYNVVKNSVLRNTMITPGRDNHGIVFANKSDYSTVMGCEIYNCAGDAIQVHPSDDAHRGCVIQDNDIYVDASRYFEKLDFFPHENGVDFKDGGAADPGDWIRVQGNRFAWIGSSDGGTGGSPGAIDFSNASGHKAYIKFSDNVFYECDLPFTTATGTGGGSSNHLSVVRNIFYKAAIAAIRPVTQKQFSHEYYFNTIVDVEEPGLWIESEVWNSDIMGNLIINGQNAAIEPNKGVHADLNVFYNTELLPLEGGGSCAYDVSDLQWLEDYCFEFARLTDPINLCIKNIVPTEKAQHVRLFENAVVGLNKDRGVDDQILHQPWAGALSPITKDIN
ncbi:hypothetical protein C7460_10629 [Marinoscillum furvescens DSM 4134]|uniref:Parallel beta helix pectate lyase-like protein n=2 Tax=Marinoscillum furvescens TaxID=1026 RepID=A0A3D9L4S3_MARFU|nr:hypothetical protein C7460_10629 [Marinoscillum furvescens DSM 4134]